MTLTLGLNSENDVYLGADGNIVVLSGIEAVAGACYTISKSRLGEMVLTTTQGIPYFETTWAGVPNLKIWQSYLTNALRNVSGVTGIKSIEPQINDNILSYTAVIETQYGTTTISG